VVSFGAMNKTKIAVAAGAVLVAIQLVPVSRTNPPVTAPVQAPPEVQAVLRRACFDCHSHETIWPAQAYLAPFSWLVAHDVTEGREELNFSAWDRADLKKVATKLPKEVGEGEMPPWFYVVAHPSARLSDAERKTLSDWARGLAEVKP
jgi:mono/diheme cytochrome c family protein